MGGSTTKKRVKTEPGSGKGEVDGDWRQALLKAAHRVAEKLGGSVSLPLLGTDREVLAIGKRQVEALGGGPQRTSLRQLLEDACRRASKELRISVRQRYPDSLPVVHVEAEREREREPAHWNERRSPRRGRDRALERVRAASADRGVDANRSSPPAAKRSRLDAPLPRKKGSGGGDDAAESSTNSNRGSGSGAPSGGVAKCDGVEVTFIKDNVPVVNLDRGSVFDLNASWLLQNSTGLYQKADSLYEDAPHNGRYKKILEECIRRGLAETDQELWVVQLRERPEVVAVGTCGKRSVMMALVIAASIQPGGHRINLPDLDDMALRQPYEKLMAAVKRAMGK